jgi:excisionase family DNA binding protein
MDTSAKNEILKEIKKLSNKVERLRQQIQEETKRSDRLITVQEAAKLLGVSEYTVRQEIRAGNLKAQRPKNARAYKISYSEIIKLIS